MSSKERRNRVGVVLVIAGLAIGTLAMAGATVVSEGIDVLGAMIAYGPFIDHDG
ncbi:MAG TPA: hypothetical protein VGG06_23420 [Thermoanaerobaculia bacterium]